LRPDQQRLEDTLIHPEVLERLPEPARQKLLLIDGLSDEALDVGEAAQGRLNQLGRMHGVGDNPTVARLAAVVEVQDHRRHELHSLVGACVRWVKALSPDTPLDVVPAPAPPPLGDEVLSAEEAVMKVRSKIGALTIERTEVQRLPEPKAVIKAAFRAEVARLASNARPMLKLDRGAAKPMFADPQADFGLSPGYAAGLLAWLFPDEVIARLDAMVEAEIDDAAALATSDQQAELGELSAGIEQLGRQEEALIEAAFAQGVDVLRRARADPACVLGVRERVAVPLARTRARPVFSGSAVASAAAE
jgi:hypothetical protein